MEPREGPGSSSGGPDGSGKNGGCGPAHFFQEEEPLLGPKGPQLHYQPDTLSSIFTFWSPC